MTSACARDLRRWAQALSVQSGCLLYCVCGLVCVVMHAYSTLTTSQFGLVLLYAGTLQRATMDLMMRLTAIEMEFVSVERIADFLRIESEREMVEGSAGEGSAGEGSIEIWQIWHPRDRDLSAALASVHTPFRSTHTPPPSTLNPPVHTPFRSTHTPPPSTLNPPSRLPRF